MSNFLYNYNRSQKMESAALILSIISATTCFIIYISLPCGALAMMFAFLSRGGNDRMSSKSIVSFWIGFSGVLLTTTIYAITFAMLISMYGSIDGILDAYSSGYGFSLNP